MKHSLICDLKICKNSSRNCKPKRRKTDPESHLFAHNDCTVRTIFFSAPSAISLLNLSFHSPAAVAFCVSPPSPSGIPSLFPAVSSCNSSLASIASSSVGSPLPPPSPLFFPHNSPILPPSAHPFPPPPH